MIKFQAFLFTSSLLVCAAAHSFAQYKVDMVSPQGATISCVAIGPAAALGRKCVEMFQEAGLVRVNELGVSGLKIGASGKNDAVIVDIQSGSAAEQAGLQVGDIITAVEGKPVKPTPGMIAAKAVFGRRGETLHLTLHRGATELQVSLVRSPQNAPEGPKSPSRFIIFRPLIDWRGQFIPCMGAGPAAPAAIEYCDSHFKSYGYIKPKDFASTGFQIDQASGDSATISDVEQGSSAADAGIHTGDKIVAVEGQPLSADVAEEARERLFGKAADRFHVTVRRGTASKSVVLELAAKPQS